MSTLADNALAVAFFYDGARETRPNRGEHVDLFVRSAGIDPEEFEAQWGKGPSWCACFVYHCLARASALMHTPCPAPRTASVHKLFMRSERYRAAKPRAGDVFGIDCGKGQGHTGFVVDVDGGSMQTIEGNTNGTGGREGDGVRQRRRLVSEATLGFLRFTAPGETDVT